MMAGESGWYAWTKRYETRHMYFMYQSDECRCSGFYPMPKACHPLVSGNTGVQQTQWSALPDAIQNIYRKLRKWSKRPYECLSVVRWKSPAAFFMGEKGWEGSGLPDKRNGMREETTDEWHTDELDTSAWSRAGTKCEVGLLLQQTTIHELRRGWKRSTVPEQNSCLLSLWLRCSGEMPRETWKCFTYLQARPCLTQSCHQ